MPPADNNAPTPTPTPEQPKQGFFAKLFGFGKKQPQAPALPQRESQTPPPQLDEPAAPADGTPSTTDPTTPTNPVPSTPVAGGSAVPASQDQSAGVPTVAPSNDPKPFDVPQDLQAQPVKADEEPVSPTLSTQPPAPANSPDGTPQAPAGK